MTQQDYFDAHLEIWFEDTKYSSNACAPHKSRTVIMKMRRPLPYVYKEMQARPNWRWCCFLGEYTKGWGFWSDSSIFPKDMDYNLEDLTERWLHILKDKIRHVEDFGKIRCNRKGKLYFKGTYLSIWSVFKYVKIEMKKEIQVCGKAVNRLRCNTTEERIRNFQDKFSDRFPDLEAEDLYKLSQMWRLYTYFTTLNPLLIRLSKNK